MLPSVCFVTTHPNPANHFVEYVQVCEERGFNCKVVVEKNESHKFTKKIKSKIIEIDLSKFDNEAWQNLIEDEIASQNLVITDIANEQRITLNNTLRDNHPEITRAVYYDNPEGYVPEEDSKLASKIIETAQIVLFANASLVQRGIESKEGISIDLSQKHTIGIGYYPKSDANKILEIRKNKEKVHAIKTSLLESNAVIDRGQKIFVYTGGANKVYYNKAFPHFIKLVSDLTKTSNSPLKDTILVLQQHPRAKTEGNLEAILVKKLLASCKLPEGFSFIISDLPTNESLAIADGLFYYQTSMAAQFVFAEIPSVIQIGHDTYTDLLVRAGFPSVTNTEQLTRILSSNKLSANIQLLEKELGIDPNWKENLLKIPH